MQNGEPPLIFLLSRQCSGLHLERPVSICSAWMASQVSCDFWLWGYLKLYVYRYRPMSLSQLKIIIHIMFQGYQLKFCESWFLSSDVCTYKWWEKHLDTYYLFWDQLFLELYYTIAKIYSEKQRHLLPKNLTIITFFFSLKTKIPLDSKCFFKNCILLLY